MPSDGLTDRNVKIILVEDNDDDAALLERHLRRSGMAVDIFRVQTATQMERALQHINAPDVVLADYHLGDGINGMELLRRLRPTQDTSLTAALITADHSPEVAVIARTAGYPLLHKPLRPAALRALLSAFRRRPKKHLASLTSSR